MTKSIVFNADIQTENEAWQDNPHQSLANALRGLASRIEDGREGPFVIFDVNGNSIGSAHLEIGDDDDAYDEDVTDPTTNTVSPSFSPAEARQLYREGKARSLTDLERMCYAGASEDARVFDLEDEMYFFNTIDGTMVVECISNGTIFRSVGFGVWEAV